jgi:hypothetical protein
MARKQSIWTRDLIRPVPPALRGVLLLALFSVLAAMMWRTSLLSAGAWRWADHIVAVFFTIIAAAYGLICALAVIDRLRTRRSLRRHAAGQCLHCGHDLAGTALRCPECGQWHGREVYGRGDAKSALDSSASSMHTDAYADDIEH